MSRCYQSIFELSFVVQKLSDKVKEKLCCLCSCYLNVLLFTSVGISVFSLQIYFQRSRNSKCSSGMDQVCTSGIQFCLFLTYIWHLKNFWDNLLYWFCQQFSSIICSDLVGMVYILHYIVIYCYYLLLFPAAYLCCLLFDHFNLTETQLRMTFGVAKIGVPKEKLGLKNSELVSCIVL